jgi:hypothetical protein
MGDSALVRAQTRLIQAAVAAVPGARAPASLAAPEAAARLLSALHHVPLSAYNSASLERLLCSLPLGTLLATELALEQPAPRMVELDAALFFSGAPTLRALCDAVCSNLSSPCDSAASAAARDRGAHPSSSALHAAAEPASDDVDMLCAHPPSPPASPTSGDTSAKRLLHGSSGARMRRATEWSTHQLFIGGLRPRVLRTFLGHLVAPVEERRPTPAMLQGATDALTSDGCTDEYEEAQLFPLAVMAGAVDACFEPALSLRRGAEALDAWCLAQMAAGAVPTRGGSGVTVAKARALARAVKRVRNTDAAATRLALAAAMLHHVSVTSSPVGGRQTPAMAAVEYMRVAGAGADAGPGACAADTPASPVVSSSMIDVVEVWAHACSGAVKLRDAAELIMGASAVGSEKVRAARLMAQHRSAMLLAVRPAATQAVVVVHALLPSGQAPAELSAQRAADVCADVACFCALDDTAVLPPTQPASAPSEVGGDEVMASSSS